MAQSIFIYMKQFLCSVHLNFGNNTHKFLHINQFMLKKFQQGAVPELLSMLEKHTHTHTHIHTQKVYTKKIFCIDQINY